MDGESDDPIIKTLDVFISKQLGDSLHLLQFPVRPASMPYEAKNIAFAKMKPKIQKVELELKINTDSPNYDSSTGEQWAINVDGMDYSKSDNYFNSSKMDRQILSSTPCNIDSRRFAIGKFVHNELHLTPLNGIVQLKPNFSYIDRAQVRNKKNYSSKTDDSSQDEEDESLTFVTAKFATKETDVAKARREASYEYYKTQEDDESWINLQYRSVKDTKHCYEKDCLLADRSNTNPVSEFYMTESEYLDKLTPNAVEMGKMSQHEINTKSSKKKKIQQNNVEFLNDFLSLKSPETSSMQAPKISDANFLLETSTSLSGLQNTLSRTTKNNNEVISEDKMSINSDDLNSKIEHSINYFVQDKLKSKSVLSMSELKLQLALHMADLPPGHILGMGISDQQLEKGVLKSNWAKIIYSGKNNENFSAFVSKSKDDSLDSIRKILIEFLSDKPSIRIGTLKKKLEEAGKINSEAEIKLVLKEYCLTKGGVWILQGFNSE